MCFIEMLRKVNAACDKTVQILDVDRYPDAKKACSTQ